jgi:outer membrane biosynthesis protein TonB
LLYHSKSEEYDRRHGRYLRWAFIASIALHILILLYFRSHQALPASPFAAAGPRTGDDRAAAGGGMQVVALQITEPKPQPVIEVVVPDPVPKPTPEEKIEVVEPPTEITAAVASIDGTALLGENRGTKVGLGTENGTGTGDGGTDAEGRFRVVPPSPRGLILPPSERPKQVRGREVEVWVFVTDGGKVIGDSTRVAPTTGDRRFDDRLKKQAAEWVFEPARRGGQPVAEWFRYIIIL